MPPISSGIVGIFSPNFSRPRDELSSTNEKVIARILIHPNCSIPWADHASPYGTWFFLESFISCHCCESNFDYLNWLSMGYDVGTIFGRHAPKIWECKKPSKIWRYFWQLSTLIANISETDTQIENRKSISSTTAPPRLDGKRPWTLVHKRKSYWRAYWPTQVDIFQETIFRPLGGAVP